MPLELKLKRGAVSGALDYFLMLDNTGIYDPTNNPGGFGDGLTNPLRANIALFLYGYKYRKDGEDQPLIIPNTIPVTVTQWQIPLSEDGYYYFQLLGFDVYDPFQAYALDVYVFYANNYYKSIDVAAIGQDPINNPLVWEKLGDLTTQAILDNTTVYKSAVSNQVLNYRAKACYQEQVQLEAENCCDCHSREQTKTKKYQKIFVHLNAASFDCMQGKYQQADEELMYLAEYCKSIHCKHCKC